MQAARSSSPAPSDRAGGSGSGRGSWTAARISPPAVQMALHQLGRRPRASARPAGPGARPAATGRAAIRPAGPGPDGGADRPTACAPQDPAGASGRGRRPRRRCRPWRVAQPVRTGTPAPRAPCGRPFSPSRWPSRWMSRPRASRASSGCRRRRGRRPSGVGRMQAGDGAQQAGLARAVGPGQGHGPLRRASVEGQALEQTPLAAREGQAGDVRVRIITSAKPRGSATRSQCPIERTWIHGRMRTRGAIAARRRSRLSPRAPGTCAPRRLPREGATGLSGGVDQRKPLHAVESTASRPARTFPSGARNTPITAFPPPRKPVWPGFPACRAR